MGPLREATPPTSGLQGCGDARSHNCGYAVEDSAGCILVGIAA